MMLHNLLHWIRNEMHVWFHLTLALTQWKCLMLCVGLPVWEWGSSSLHPVNLGQRWIWAQLFKILCTLSKCCESTGFRWLLSKCSSHVGTTFLVTPHFQNSQGKKVNEENWIAKRRMKLAKGNTALLLFYFKIKVSLSPLELIFGG